MPSPRLPPRTRAVKQNLMPPPRLIRRHDQFFKRLLERDGTAGALLRERLPPAVAGNDLVPTHRNSSADSFVSRELQGHQTDRLYRARMVDGEIAFIYALIEHKSSPDLNVTLQLLGYMVQIWQWWIRQEGNGRKQPAATSCRPSSRSSSIMARPSGTYRSTSSAAWIVNGR